MGKTKYAFYNVAKNDFSESWNEEQHELWIKERQNMIPIWKQLGIKLIKYECLNDENFRLNHINNQ